MHKRSAKEIQMRCKSIFSNPEIVTLVKESSSPTSAYEMTVNATGNEKTAKAARWLAVLRRDYPEAYQETILCHAQEGTAMKGEKNERSLCGRPT